MADSPTKRLCNHDVEDLCSPNKGAMVIYGANHPLEPLFDKKGIASIDELVKSPAVTLKVGPEGSLTTVQAILFRGISEPLHARLTSYAVLNGDLTDLTEDLRHDDKIAFVQLTKLAYTAIMKNQTINNIATPAAHSCSSTEKPSETSLSKRCPDCKKPRMKLIYVCSSCVKSISEKQDTIGLQQFLELQLPGLLEGINKHTTSSSTTLFASLDTKDPTTTQPYPLLHFAKIFTFAAKYEVKDLRIAAFKAFQRCLKRLPALHTDQTDEIVDCLQYLASSTTSSGIFPALTASLLPDLPHINGRNEATNSTPDHHLTSDVSNLLFSLMTYITVEIKHLLYSAEFQEVVLEHGVIGLAMMHVLRQSMIASEPEGTSK